MKPRWKRVDSSPKHLDSILTRFQEKLAPLKKQLDEEVKKLNEAISAEQKEKTSQQNSEEP